MLFFSPVLRFVRRMSKQSQDQVVMAARWHALRKQNCTDSRIPETHNANVSEVSSCATGRAFFCFPDMAHLLLADVAFTVRFVCWLSGRLFTRRREFAKKASLHHVMAHEVAPCHPFDRDRRRVAGRGTACIDSIIRSLIFYSTATSCFRTYPTNTDNRIQPCQ